MQMIPIDSHSQVWVLFPFPRDSHRVITTPIPFPNMCNETLKYKEKQPGKNKQETEIAVHRCS